MLMPPTMLANSVMFPDRSYTAVRPLSASIYFAWRNISVTWSWSRWPKTDEDREIWYWRSRWRHDTWRTRSYQRRYFWCIIMRAL